MKPFAESCEQNKHAILEILEQEFSNAKQVLEIGSGTGQHAVFFSQQLPHLTWQTSDVAEHHSGIQAWIDELGPENIRKPFALNVDIDLWPETAFDAIFSANTVHIMGWLEVQKMFAAIGNVLTEGGRFCLYGPFNVDGKFTSESNANFEQWLKSRDTKSGIRDKAELDALAEQAGLKRVADHAMPANNNILVWVKTDR